MAKIKIKKCTVEFEALDTAMAMPIEIGVRQYEAQLNFLLQQVVKTANDECPMEHRCYHKEYEKYTKTTHFFTVGTADTILTEIVCKAGYRFEKGRGSK